MPVSKMARNKETHMGNWVSRKQATEIINATFSMFHYGLTALPDMGIKNTKEKEDFLRAAWKLDETINTDNYADTVNALDSTGFKEYYNLIGAFAKKYNIANWQDYNEYEPVLIEYLNEELGRHEKTEEKLELINSFHDEELQSEKFLYEAKEKFIKDILDEFAVFNPKEQSINRILKTFTESEKRKFTAFLFDNNQLYLNKILSKINGKEYKKLITLLDFDRKEIDFKSYKKSWIVVKNESGLIEKIIYNAGNDITFVNIYGEILEEIPFDTACRKTEFLNKYLGIGNSGDILIKAGYSYKDGIFIGNDKAKRAFDLNGNEASLDFQYRKKNKKALLSSENIDISKKQKEPDFFKQVWETLFESKSGTKKDTSFSNVIKENENIKKTKQWGNNEHHCDEYCEAILISAGKLPKDWPSTNLKVSWNDNGERKDSFMEYYRSQLKDTPELGWNIMLMDGHANSGIILPPHMVVIYVRDDGLIDFSHYTSDKVVPPRIGWTIEEMTDTGKGNYDRFGYSNFKYLPLGK